MKRRGDCSGQIMLTGAFLLAVTLVSIALILNNVVYFSNVSYMGFMDHSGTGEVSIKSLVAQGAIQAYDEARGDRALFNTKMRDLANSLNNVTLPKGSHIVISPPYFFETAYSTTSTYPSTKFNLAIYTKDSIKNYSINTTHYPPLIPTPGPTPLKCEVKISSPGNTSIVYQGENNHTSVIINVINLSDNTPATYQVVKLKHDTSIGSFYFDESRSLIVDTSDLMTDSTGTIKLYWYPNAGLGSEGTDVINASVGYTPSLADKNLSNNVILVNRIFHSCNHTINIGGALHYTNHNGNDYYINIEVPISVPVGSNFNDFSVGALLNSSASINAISLSYSDMGNFNLPGYITGPLTSPYDKIVIRLGWPNATGQNKPFSAVFTVTVSAYCNIDNVYYSNVRTFTVTGPP